MRIVATRRFEVDIEAISYVADDLIGSRGLVSSWPLVSGLTVDGCEVLYMHQLRTIIPQAARGPGTPFFVVDLTCRAAKFKLELSSGSPTNDIDVSVQRYTLKSRRNKPRRITQSA